MPLDTRLPLLVRTPQPITREQAAATGFQMRGMKRAEDEANTQLQAKRTIQDLYRQNVGADGTLDSAGFEQGVAQAGLGDQLPDIQKARLTNEKTRTDTQASQFKLAKERADALSGSLASLLANPAVSHQDVYSQLHNLVDGGIISAEQGAAAARGLPGKPEALRPFLVQQALAAADASKRLEAVLPKFDEQDRGGVINEGTVDQLTGRRTPGTDIKKTATPGEVLTDKRNPPGAGFGGENQALLAALATRGVSLPAGFRSQAQMAATLQGLIARNPGKTVDDIADGIANGQIDFSADKKSSQTAAALGGKIAYAENEIKLLAPLVRQASAAVPRGNFVPWNKLSQYGDAQISDPALKEFKSYMTSLSNAYDMLAARGGTDMDKRRHNRELFDTADSPEALEAALKAVENEADISGKAARESMKPHSQQGNIASDVPDDIAALLKKHGAK
jgi:hypothetical protein